MFELIDRYLSFDLTLTEMAEVENLIQSDELYYNEFKFQAELHESLNEKEIMSLRENLKSILKAGQSQYSNDTSFTLLQESNSGNIPDSLIDTKIFVNFYSPLPRIHLIHHNQSLNENVHHLYRHKKTEGVAETESGLNELNDGVISLLGEVLLDNQLVDKNEKGTDLSSVTVKQPVSEMYLEKDIELAISETDIMALRDNLQGMRHYIQNNENKKIKTLPVLNYNVRRIISSAAAVILLVIGIGTLVTNMTGQKKQMFNSAFVAYPSNSISRSASDDNQLGKRAFELYDKKNYNKAISEFQQVLKQSDKPVYHFFMGMSFQAIGENRNAVEEYRKVISDNNNRFVEEAEWNLCRCLFNSGDIQQTRARLFTIAEKNGYYSNEAKKELRKMR